MLQRRITRNATAARLLITAFFLALGWAYLHSVLTSPRSERPSSLSASYELAARHDAPSDSVASDSWGSAFNRHALESGRSSQPAQRNSSGDSAETRSGRRQALAALTAMLIQIQSAGAGGR